MVASDSQNGDEELIRELCDLWLATRTWAEAMLVKVVGLREPSQVLANEHRGFRQIGDTGWYYRTHGLGVDICREDESDGIDFDFDKSMPDPWRLQIFAEKQVAAGNLSAQEYGPLIQDPQRTGQIRPYVDGSKPANG